ncbi:hypothetical protein BU23DRAFT_570840 [Bimuria novae-zelandiae CBS 107.79]|uniref:Uncharacterized protein n=1 Tax=Bimuria novae-zelandiae CBS 107.79 TaxID=1447943 RepID=A0A6A5UYK2_9PLEO|nr:hypothetical protein BU23DRAFT_570840 [Bimuria novae-zelandiae CBS 107.79]
MDRAFAMRRNATFCENLYEPNPDIAGQGLYALPPQSHQSAPGDDSEQSTRRSDDSGPIRVSWDRYASSDDGEIILRRDTGDESERRDDGDQSARRDGNRRRTAPFQACRSGKAVVDLFTRQYIVGLAYVVAAFIKHSDISYYHLRIVLELCSINIVVLFVCAYTRKTLPGLVERQRARERTAPQPWPRDRRFFGWQVSSGTQFQDSVALLSFGIFAGLHLGLVVHTVVRSIRDENFQRCFPADHGTLIFTVVLLACFYYAFYNVSADEGPSGGRRLDLDRIHKHFSDNGGSILSSFVIFCSVLVPLLPGKLRQEVLHSWYSGLKGLAQKSKKGLSAMSAKLSGVSVELVVCAGWRDVVKCRQATWKSGV